MHAGIGRYADCLRGFRSWSWSAKSGSSRRPLCSCSLRSRSSPIASLP